MTEPRQPTDAETAEYLDSKMDAEVAAIVKIQRFMQVFEGHLESIDDEEVDRVKAWARNRYWLFDGDKQVVEEERTET
jgi:hypothetical protein